jgi:hypothetical protein
MHGGLQTKEAYIFILAVSIISDVEHYLLNNNKPLEYESSITR